MHTSLMNVSTKSPDIHPLCVESYPSLKGMHAPLTIFSNNLLTVIDRTKMQIIKIEDSTIYLRLYLFLKLTPVKQQ